MQKASSSLSLTLVCLLWCQVHGQSEGDLRLVNRLGSTGGSSGRLEIYHNFRWGTVCDDFFGSPDATVACRQLGYSVASRYGRVGSLGFSQASLSTRTWLDNLNCRGSESRLASCRHNGYGMENCNHSEDVGLLCSGSTSLGPSDGDLRLNRFGSTGGSSGRLEIYHNSQWGTVCDDFFGSPDATVACRQLGYSVASRYGRVGSLGFSQASSSTRTWLDNLNCRGSENRLASCRHNGYGVENCNHSDDVGLLCSGSTSLGPSDGDLRLNSYGSTGGSSGRLEIYYNSQWGTVCDDSFGSMEADVACRQLGYSSASSYGSVGTLGFSRASSSTRTWLDNVNCFGSESRLASCRHRGYGVEDCSHFDDVGLLCSRTSTGAIAGGVVGGVVPFIVIVVVCIVLCIAARSRANCCTQRTVRTFQPPTTTSANVVTYSTTQGITRYPTHQGTYSAGPQQPSSVYPTQPYLPVNSELSAAAPPAYNTVSAYPSPANPSPPTDPNAGSPPGYPTEGQYPPQTH